MVSGLDGICEECGNTGIVGEICSFCGNKIAPLDAGLERFEREENLVIPKAKKSRATDDFDVEPDLEELEEMDELEDDLDELEELDEEGDLGTTSLEELAEDEETRENRKGDLKSINIDEDNDEES